MSNRVYGPSGAPGVAGAVALNTPGAAAGVLPATQVVTTTAETIILNPALNSTTQALVCSIPNGGPLDGLPAKLIWSGILETAQSSTATLKIYSGTSTTVGSDTLLGSSGAISAFSGKCPFFVILEFIFDSVSGKMGGKVSFVVNNTVVATVALSNVITSINNVNNPVFSFVPSVTFGTATAPNTIVTREFAVYEE